MKVLIICSKKFYNKIPIIKNELEKNNIEVYLPNCYDELTAEEKMWDLGKEEHQNFKTEMYKQSEETISKMDAVLVLNFDKEKDNNTIKNYIGGATFPEIYDAFRFNKKIYLYNEILEGILYDEIDGFSPIIINGDVSLIKEKKEVIKMAKDMYQKRKERKEAKDSNTEVNTNKTNINWYPGHMAKTKRKIKESINLIDIVYEVIDSRVPKSSKMDEFDTLFKDKIKVLIMTKKDLCDEKVTNKYVKEYENKGYYVLLMDLTNNKDYELLFKLTKDLTKELQEKRKAKGLLNKEIKAIVVGVPNVGKSTLINALAGKTVAKVENKPGVTKNLNWLKTKENILIMDTPGILEPKIKTKEMALNLASTGAIKKEIFQINEIATYILLFLQKNYPKYLKERYDLSDKMDILEMYEILGNKLGYISNHEVDYDKVSDKIYYDMLKGRIKGITLDR